MTNVPSALKPATYMLQASVSLHTKWEQMRLALCTSLPYYDVVSVFQSYGFMLQVDTDECKGHLYRLLYVKRTHRE